MRERCVGDARPTWGLRTVSDRGQGWWAHQDLNLEPTNYEFAALTN